MIRLRSWAFAVLVPLVLLTACSRLAFVYDNADWLLARQIAGFLDLDREQRDYVRDQLSDYRAFHRRVRVPQLLALIERTRELVKHPSPEARHIREHFEMTERLLHRTAEDLIPLTADVLHRLSPEQLDHLEQEFNQRGQERKETSDVGGSADLTDSIEDWTGPLSDQQKALLESCRTRLPDTTEHSLAWRQHQQRRLLSLLRSGATEAQLSDFFTAWWLGPDQRPKSLRNARAVSRSLWFECAATLLQRLTPAHVEHALERLDHYESSLVEIKAD